MDDNSKMLFGKYKGEKLANLPAWYLLWLKDEGYAKGELLDYINDNEPQLIKEKGTESQRSKKR
jgi:uncharacterized protein (DUF3820 family)